MAVKWPAANGNWSNAANWNGGTKPTTGDVVHADGKTVTIDEDFNLGASSKLTTETRSGGTAGGGFTFSTERTLTVAEIVSNVASACLTYTGAGAATVSANGTASFNNAACIAVNHTGAGTLTVNGNGTNASAGRAFQNNSTGTMTITGNPSTSGSGSGANNNSTGTLNITGNPTTTSSGAGAFNNSTGTLNITGNPSTTGGGNGARNASTGTMNIATVGTLSGNNSVIAATGANIFNNVNGTVTVTGNLTGSSLTPRGIVLHNFADGAVTVNGTLASGDLSEGQYANRLGACALRNDSPTVAATVTTFTDVGAIQGLFNATTYPEILTLTYDGGLSEVEYYLNDPANGEIPAEVDVRFGTEYALSRTGTCHVPPAESVALNVPVDDTVGSYVGGGGGASAEDIYAYFTADSRADAFKADVSAIPTNPLLTNDVRLDNLDATVSSRLATSGYTAPNNAGIAAIPTNPLLTTDARLDNLNATIGSRLASVDYTEPDNTSIGEIKTKVDSLENAPTVQDIRVELEDPPLPVNTTKMNDEVIVGKGIPSDLWRGSGV
jgi:hypothetical protein